MLHLLVDSTFYKTFLFFVFLLYLCKKKLPKKDYKQ